MFTPPLTQVRVNQYERQLERHLFLIYLSPIKINCVSIVQMEEWLVIKT